MNNIYWFKFTVIIITNDNAVYAKFSLTKHLSNYTDYAVTWLRCCLYRKANRGHVTLWSTAQLYTATGVEELTTSILSRGGAPYNFMW